MGGDLRQGGQEKTSKAKTRFCSTDVIIKFFFEHGHFVGIKRHAGVGIKARGAGRSRLQSIRNTKILKIPYFQVYPDIFITDTKNTGIFEFLLVKIRLCTLLLESGYAH